MGGIGREDSVGGQEKKGERIFSKTPVFAEKLQKS